MSWQRSRSFAEPPTTPVLERSDPMRLVTQIPAQAYRSPRFLGAYRILHQKKAAACGLIFLLGLATQLLSALQSRKGNSGRLNSRFDSKLSVAVNALTFKHNSSRKRYFQSSQTYPASETIETRGTTSFKAPESLWVWIQILAARFWRGAQRAKSPRQARLPAHAEDSSTKQTDTQALATTAKGFLVDQIEGVHIAYAMCDKQPALGVALLFHGCGQTALDWFQLPEHRAVVRRLQNAHLAILALTSVSNLSKCWSTRYPATENDDATRVSVATRQWFDTHEARSNIPIYGVGLSSGGTFLSILATSAAMPRLSSQVIYVSPGSMRAFRGKRSLVPYPSTLFVYVPGDAYGSKERVLAARDALIEREQGHVQVGVLALKPPKLDFTTLLDHEPRFSEHAARHIVELLAQSQRAYSETIRLNADDEVILKVHADPRSRLALEQIIKVLSGQHELSSVHADWVVSWLTAHGMTIPSTASGSHIDTLVPGA
jgi:hypothetical protein